MSDRRRARQHHRLCGPATVLVYGVRRHVLAAPDAAFVRYRVFTRVGGAVCRGRGGRYDYRLPPRDGRDPSLAHASQGPARRLAHSARAYRLYLAPHGLLKQGRCTQPIPLQKARLYDHLRYRGLYGACDLRYGHPRYVGGAFAQAVRAYHALRPAGGRQSRRFFTDVRGIGWAQRVQ